MTDIKIFVSHYKRAQIIENGIIKPMQVGTALGERLPGMAYYDNDSEDNISELNKKYCELTGIYYAWKHISADYYGFCHYRRFFSFSPKRNSLTAYVENLKKHTPEEIIRKYGMDEENITATVKDYDVLMQKPYYIFITNRFMYSISPSGKTKDLDWCLQTIKRDYPEMYKTAKRYMHCPMSYTCNMFIMKKEIFFDYCEWLFDILQKFDKEVDCSAYTPVQYHVSAYLAERLTGIYWHWLKKQKKYKLRTLSRVFFNNTEPRV